MDLVIWGWWICGFGERGFCVLDSGIWLMDLGVRRFHYLGIGAFVYLGIVALGTRCFGDFGFGDLSIRAFGDFDI